MSSCCRRKSAAVVVAAGRDMLVVGEGPGRSSRVVRRGWAVVAFVGVDRSRVYLVDPVKRERRGRTMVLFVVVVSSLRIASVLEGHRSWIVGGSSVDSEVVRWVEDALDL